MINKINQVPSVGALPEHFVINSDTDLLECLRRLDRTGCHVLVCIEDGRISGVVSEGDIRRGLLNDMSLDQKVEPLINKNPVVITKPFEPEAVIALMRKRMIDGIPVINNKGDFVEFLTLASLLRRKNLPNTAVIMAGGMGTRLHPLTLQTPKPLLPVAGRPMIEHIIEQLSDEGIRRFFVTTNYLAKKFPEILGDGSHLGVEISYICEDKQLGTLGALSLIDRKKLSEPIIVTNGDVLSKLNVSDFLHHHSESGASLTICVKEYNHRVPYGVISIKDNAIIGLDEKPEQTFIVNAGVYCIDLDVLSLIPRSRPLDFPDFVKLLDSSGHSMSSFTFEGYWRDIGTIEDYSHANIEFREFSSGSD